MQKILAAVRGLSVPPWLAGLIRAAIEAGSFAALYVLLDGLVPALPDELAWAGPIAIAVARPIEGALDQIDPAKGRQR